VDVLVILIKANNLALDMPCFKVSNPEVDWSNGQLTTLQMPKVPQWVKIPEADCLDPLPECLGVLHYHRK